MPLTGSELEVPLYVRLANGTIYRAGTTGLSKDAADALYLPLAGGTLTGPLVFPGDTVWPMIRMTPTATIAMAGGRVEIRGGATEAIYLNSESTAYNSIYLDATGGIVLASVDAGVEIWSVLDMTGNRITNVGPPTAATDAVNRNFVDARANKAPVKLVTTANWTLSGLGAIDGTAPSSGDRILVTAQSTASQNGIYTAASGAWTRAIDMDASGDLADGTLVPVAQGTANADSLYMCTGIGTTPWVPGSSTSVWTRYSGVTDVTAGAGMTRSGQALNVVSANTDMTVGTDNITINSAPKWTTGRTIALTGDITGTSAAFDGQANLSFATAIGAGVIVDADVAAANKDGAVGTPSMRTLGTGAQQAAAGNHAHAGVYDPAGTASSAVSTHAAAADPHTGYQKETEKAVANGYASLDGTTKVPIAQIPTGTTASTVAIGDDSRLSNARTPTGTASGDLSGTYPSPQIATGVIVDADVNASAAIAQSKISGLTTDLNAKWTMWTGTQAAYDAIGTKDPSTLYVIV